jgi:cell division protein FtsB
MKHSLNKLSRILKNFYILTALFFLSWLLIFDSNDIVTQVKLSNKESDLRKTKAFYNAQIEGVKSDREALLNNDDLLERIAREKYFMKRDNEDVFVVVEADK